MKYKLNVSIDDICPHPRSSTKVLERCFELIEIFPKIKFSLFIPMAYWRTQRRGTITPQPLFISKFPEFCYEVEDLPEENFELGWHGFFHGIPQKSDNNEFDGVDYEKATLILNNMFKEADKAGIRERFSPILRAPNWKMSAGTFEAANDLGIELFALTDIESRLETHGGMHEKYDSVYSNFSPPNRDLEITPRCGVVYHACEWLKNYLDHQKTQELVDFIQQYEEDIEFCFLRGLENKDG
mgnify:FL=1|jgi:hypothetical protein